MPYIRIARSTPLNEELERELKNAVSHHLAETTSYHHDWILERCEVEPMEQSLGAAVGSERIRVITTILPNADDDRLAEIAEGIAKRWQEVVFVGMRKSEVKVTVKKSDEVTFIADA